MRFEEVMCSLKNEDLKKICFMENGTFYIAIGADARFLNEDFDFILQRRGGCYTLDAVYAILSESFVCKAVAEGQFSPETLELTGFRVAVWLCV